MKILKKTGLYIFFINLLLLSFSVRSYALTFDWTGASTYYWNNPANWLVGGFATTTYPGDPLRAGSNADIAQIGVSYYFNGFSGTFLPIIQTGLTINMTSVIMGDNTNINSGSQVFNYLVVNGTLNVSGTFLQLHSNNIGFSGNGTPGYPLNYDFVIHTFIWGTGTINAATLQVGDTTLPPTGLSNVTRLNFGSYGPCPTVNITGDFIINSMSSNDTGTLFVNSSNNAEVGINNGGNITIGGQLKLTNSGVSGYDPLNYSPSQPQFQPHSWFSMQVFNHAAGVTPYTSVLNFQGANALYNTPASNGKIGNNFFDFYYIDRAAVVAGTTSNLDHATVNYTGNVDQEVYTNASFPISTILDIDGGIYQNLGFSGSGKKTIDATTIYPLTISGDMTLAAGTETVDLSTNNPTITLNNSNIVFTSYGTNTTTNPNILVTIPYISNFSSAANAVFQNGTTALTIPGTTTNGGTFNTSASTVTLSGAFTNSGSFNQTGAGVINLNNSYTNTGTFSQTAGTVNINQSGAQSLTDNSAANQGTTFFNVNVQNGGTKTLSGSATGQFHVSSTGVLTMVSTTALAANSFLTINSDINGSGTVMTIPSDCSITGNVNVQRYLPGGSAGRRGYRLMSSPVTVGTDGFGNKIYGLNYLTTSSYTTGTNGVAGGFNQAGNPSLYLYRENMPPSNTTFTSGNYRGIADMSSPTNLSINGDGTGFSIPVGNGYLMFFRGGTGTVNPFVTTSTPAAATLSATGTLNQGSITVNDWYTPGVSGLGYTTLSGDPTIEGFNLVGNPYASTIDLGSYTTGGINMTNLSVFVYELDPTSKNFGVYALDGSASPTNNASRYIASGQGFFVMANSASPTPQITFNETAKVTTQNTGLSLLMGKPPVANTNIQYMRLQMAMDSVNSDETIIGFNDNTKNNYVFNEDALYRIGTGKVSLASLSVDNKVLAINRLPLSKSLVIPLKVSATANGTYTLNMKDMVGIPQLYSVYLKDAHTKDSVNMRTTKSYSFSIALTDTSTFGKNRFSLVLRQDPALAYQLLNLNADKTNNTQVEVVWNTLNEANYTHFTVERSTDGGTSFDVIGGLNSSGNGTYSILDKSPLKGENIYRLKQEDFNNTISYSKVVQVEFTPKSDNLAGVRLSVYPNPAVDNISLTINPKSQEAATYHIRVTNSAGVVVKQIVTTQTTWKDNVSNLFTGTYLVQVVNDKDNSLVGQTKFVKL